MDNLKLNKIIETIEDQIHLLRTELFTNTTPVNEIQLQPGADINAAIAKLNLMGGTIILEPGIYNTAPIIIGKRDVNKTITIRSSISTPGRRVTRKDALFMPTLQSPNLEPTFKAKIQSGGIVFRNINFGPAAFDRNMVELGGDANELKVRADRPSIFTFDGCLFTGSPTLGQHRAILVNALTVNILNCSFYDIFEYGRDSQAICGWNGTEDIWIENCYIEGGAENIIFGGADSASPDMIPMNIAIIGCKLSKNYMAWMALPRGKEINIKALFELKNVINFHMNGCILENCWAKNWSSGVGMTLKSCNSGQEPWATMENVIVENTVIRNVGSPLNVIGQNDSGNPSVRGRNIILRNILSYNLNKPPFLGDGRCILLTNPPNDWTVENCTFLGNNNSMVALAIEDKVAKATGFKFRNNVLWHGEYGFFSSYGMGTTGIKVGFADDFEFVRNIMRRNEMRQNTFPESNTIVLIPAFDAAISANFEYVGAPGVGINYANLIGAMRDPL